MNLELLIFQILNYTIFNNELWRYLTFIILLSITYPLGKIIYHIMNDYILKLTEKTKVKFDDIVVKSLIPTLNMFLFATMFYYASKYLVLGSSEPVFTKIFNFLLIVPFVYFMVRFTTEMIGYYLKDKREKKDVNEAAVDLLMQVIRIALYIIGFLLVLSNLGFNITALLTGLGVGGLAFALAAQDVLKNFFAGVALIIDGTFKKGDRIKFQNQVAYINEVKLRTTKLKTLDGTILTVPNSMLAENIVENIALAPKYKVNMVISLTYDTSTKKLRDAKKIIHDILEKDKDIDEWWVLFDNFGAYSLDIQVIYFMKYNYSEWPQRGEAKERINFAIKEELEKARINMAFPTQTIEIKK